MKTYTPSTTVLFYHSLPKQCIEATAGQWTTACELSKPLEIVKGAAQTLSATTSGSLDARVICAGRLGLSGRGEIPTELGFPEQGSVSFVAL